MYKRVVIKISGEALAGSGGFGFDEATVTGISAQTARVIKNGTQAALVVGGGNFWRGRQAGDDMDRVVADQIGMMATVMNALRLADALRLQGVPSAVMTPFSIGAITELYVRDRASEYLEQGYALVFACGTGHPFFSTDTITAIRGAELGADALLFAKNVDGVYDSDPAVNKQARKLQRLTYREILAGNLRAIDLAVCGICMDTGLTSIVFGLNEPGGLMRAASGDDSEISAIGTKITI